VGEIRVGEVEAESRKQKAVNYRGGRRQEAGGSDYLGVEISNGVPFLPPAA
jgi:hypothetical protein